MLTVEVNLSNILKNTLFLKSKLGAVCAVVKANAYGHGAVMVARYIEKEVACFAVATVDEAIELYNGGIRKDIIVFCVEDFSRILPKSVIPTVTRIEQIDLLSPFVSRICIKVNTGMNRYGCSESEVRSIYDYCLIKGKTVHSVYSHLYYGDSLTDSRLQYERFINCTKDLESVTLRHICASNALGLKKNFYLDMVRAGIALYGYGAEKLLPAMEVFTSIVQINEVKRGEHIGYGSYLADKDMRIATLRMGYADGLRRNAKNISFIVNGVRCALVGQVCMDACFIDITGVECKMGDSAYYLLGKTSMEEKCLAFNTIPYEILTALGSRAKRIYYER